MRPAVLLGLSVAVVAMLAWVMDRRSQPVRRSVQTAAQELSELDVYAPGRIEGADEPVRLRAELRGRVVEVSVKEGQFVRAGEVLVRLDDELVKAQLAEAEAIAAAATARLARLINGARPEEIEAARQRYSAALALARQRHHRWQRLRALWERDGTRRQEVEEEQYAYLAAAAEAEAAKAEYERIAAEARPEDVQAAEAEVAAAQARVRFLRAQLDKHAITAPFDGQVLQVNCRVGELLDPALPEPAVVMVAREPTHVRAFVEEFDAARVHIGQQAIITVDGLPNEEFSGQVTRLSPIVQRKHFFTFEPGERYDSRVREIWIALDGPVDLPIGLRVHVRLLAQKNQVAGRSAPPARLTFEGDWGPDQ